MSACQTFEDYLRGQVEKGQYGVAIIQARIALDIADYIEKHRRFTIEPKKGRWITKSTNGEMFDSCSVCGYVEWDVPRNYCPNCGADMRGEANEVN